MLVRKIYFGIDLRINDYTWYILPVANPDGYEFTYNSVSKNIVMFLNIIFMIFLKIFYITSINSGRMEKLYKLFTMEFLDMHFL